MSILAALILAIPATVAAILGAKNGRKLHEIRIEINSRLSQLLVKTAEAAHAAGKTEERSEEKQRQTNKKGSAK